MLFVYIVKLLNALEFSVTDIFLCWASFVISYYFLIRLYGLTILSIFKGAMKLYFMYYSRVVIYLFSTELYKSAFSNYSFRKLVFLLSLFSFLFIWCFKFDVISKNFILFVQPISDKFVIIIIGVITEFTDFLLIKTVKNNCVKKHAFREVLIFFHL